SGREEESRRNRRSLHHQSHSADPEHQPLSRALSGTRGPLTGVLDSPVVSAYRWALFSSSFQVRSMPRSHSHPFPASRVLSIAIPLLAAGLLGTIRAGEPAAPLRLVTGMVCEKGEKKEDIARVESSGVRFAARPLTEREWEARMEQRSLGMGAAFRPADG